MGPWSFYKQHIEKIYCDKLHIPSYILVSSAIGLFWDYLSSGLTVTRTELNLNEVPHISEQSCAIVLHLLHYHRTRNHSLFINHLPCISFQPGLFDSSNVVSDKPRKPRPTSAHLHNSDAKRARPKSAGM